MSPTLPTDNRFKVGDDGRALPIGQTHRIYRFAPGAVDDFSITMPPDAAFVSVNDPDVALSYEINTVARGSIEGVDSRRDIAIDEEGPLRPIVGGEFLNISAQSGDIGFFTIIIEGGTSLPQQAADLTSSDPGP